MAFRESRQPSPNIEVEAVDNAAPNEVVRAALADIAKKGRLTPDGVLEAARDPAHPLHGHFDWDNESAGHSWRIEQARKLIRSVRVTVVFETDTLAAPFYVRDPSAERAQGYVSVETARKEPENARAIMRYEFERAITHCNRAVAVAAAVGVEPQAKKIVGQIQALLARLT